MNNRSDHSFVSKENATRALVAAILMNFMRRE